ASARAGCQARTSRSGRRSRPRSVLLSRSVGSPVNSNEATRLASAPNTASASSRATACPHAAMDAGAKGHMPGGAALDVEFIRPLPAAGIAVGGGEEQEHLFALAEPHA